MSLSHEIKRPQPCGGQLVTTRNVYFFLDFPHSQRPLFSGITWLHLKWRIPSSLIFSQQDTCLRGKTNVTFSGSLWEILTTVFLEAILESIENQVEHPYYTGPVHWAQQRKRAHMVYGKGSHETPHTSPKGIRMVSKVSPLLDLIYTHSQTEVTQTIWYPSWRVDPWVKNSPDEGPWDTV